MNAEKTGALIRALRTEQGLTQKQLADRLHLSDRTVSKWERGAGCPDVSLLGALARELGVVPFPVSWTVKMKTKQKETQDILSYHTQAAGCSDKARAKASGGRQPIEECGRTGL